MAELLITENDFLTVIRTQIGEGSAKDFADRVGVSPQFISDVLKLRRAPTDNLAKAMGYDRIVFFRASRKKKVGR